MCHRGRDSSTSSRLRLQHWRVQEHLGGVRREKEQGAPGTAVRDRANCNSGPSHCQKLLSVSHRNLAGQCGQQRHHAGTAQFGSLKHQEPGIILKEVVQHRVDIEDDLRCSQLFNLQGYFAEPRACCPWFTKN